MKYNQIKYSIRVSLVIAIFLVILIVGCMAAIAQDSNGVWVLTNKSSQLFPQSMAAYPAWKVTGPTVSGNSITSRWDFTECSEGPGYVADTMTWTAPPLVLKPGTKMNTTITYSIQEQPSCKSYGINEFTGVYVGQPGNPQGLLGEVHIVGNMDKGAPQPVSGVITWNIPSGNIGDAICYELSYKGNAGFAYIYYNYTYQASIPSVPTPEAKPQQEVPVQPKPFENATELPCPEGLIDSGATFSSVNGEVKVNHCGDEKSMHFAKKGATIYWGDHILTGEDSSTIICFSDLSTLVLKSESEFVMGPPTKKYSNLDLLLGRLKINFKHMLNGESLEVGMFRTVTGIKGTTIVCEETGRSSTLKVLEGTASFRDKATGEEVMVNAGEMATATESGLSPIQSFDIEAENASWENLTSKPENGGIVTGTSNVIFNNWNTGGVVNNPTQNPSFTIFEPYMISYIDTYHWNFGSGTAAGGTIGLKKEDSTKYGPWQVETKSGQGGVPNAWWITHPNETIPAGTYTIIDSDPASWSQNSGSNGCGFSKVEGYPTKTNIPTLSPTVNMPVTPHVSKSGEVPTGSVQSGCYTDTATGKTICADTSNDLYPYGSNQESPIILASAWTVKEMGPQGNYYGTWTRRQGTNTFDASWSGGSITDVIDITSIEGNKITLHRHGNNGNYLGTISPDGTGISGTASWYVLGETWTASTKP